MDEVGAKEIKMSFIALSGKKVLNVSEGRVRSLARIGALDKMQVYEVLLPEHCDENPDAYMAVHVCGSGVITPYRVSTDYNEIMDIFNANELQDEHSEALSLESRVLKRVKSADILCQLEEESFPEGHFVGVLGRDQVIYNRNKEPFWSRKELVKGISGRFPLDRVTLCQMLPFEVSARGDPVGYVLMLDSSGKITPFGDIIPDEVKLSTKMEQYPDLNLVAMKLIEVQP